MIVIGYLLALFGFFLLGLGLFFAGIRKLREKRLLSQTSIAGWLSLIGGLLLGLGCLVLLVVSVLALKRL